MGKYIKGITMDTPIYKLKDFPTENGYHARRYTDTRHSLHFHDYIEITILEKGSGIHVINGTEYYYPIYTYTIMDHRDCHAFFNLSQDNSLYNLVLSPSLLSNGQLTKILRLTSDKICYLNEDTAKSVIALIDSLYYLQKTAAYIPPDFIRNVSDNLVELFMSNFINQKNVDTLSQKSELQQALEYISLHFKEKITLTEVAEHSNYNPTHFSKLFHKKMGVTFNHYVSSLRVNYAKRLLLNTEYPISFICFECGFSSVSSFNRNFSEIVGMSPITYKSEYK